MESTHTLIVTTPSDRQIAMTRVFDAPRALVFDALTKPDLMKRWFAPPGWTFECEIDLRVGGAYRYVWRKEDATESEWSFHEGVMGMGGTFTEVDPPARFAGTEKYDEAWYEGDASSVTELVEQDGKTTLTMTVTYASKEVRDFVLQTGASDGVEANFDQLAALLPSL
jgi:uncharacterized protein YndB with AHSA1/START domain